MLNAVGDGETDPAAVAALADQRLRATPEQLRDAFGACADLHPVYRRLVKLTLDELRVIEDHLGQLDQQMADLLAAHHDAVQRLAEVPGLGVDHRRSRCQCRRVSVSETARVLDGRVPRQ
jgi:transposase